MEELRKEKSKVEELNKVQNDLEKNNTQLIKDVTALKEKREKVGHFYSNQQQHRSSPTTPMTV